MEKSCHVHAGRLKHVLWSQLWLESWYHPPLAVWTGVSCSHSALSFLIYKMGGGGGLTVPTELNDAGSA